MSRRFANSAIGGTLVITVALSGYAWAGKPERDKQEELTPKLAEAAKNVETTCGCNVEITVAWDSYKKADDMFRIPNTLGSFVDTAKHQCNNAANKKAFCSNVSKLEVRYPSAELGDIEYDAKTKTIKCTSTDMSYTAEHQFKAILDKF